MTLPKVALASIVSVAWLIAGAPGAQAAEPKKVSLHEDFEKGFDAWEPMDKSIWTIKKCESGQVLSQTKKESSYKPPVRSPVNIVLLKDHDVAACTIEGKVLSTVKDYAHRDAVVVFGYQDASHFYYVHLGKQTDDHANQIFIVNGAPRAKISTKTSTGTNWDDKWHHVKVVRKPDEGTIEVYFDDMKAPVMTANDKTFAHGRIGIGSFDDTTDWDDVKLEGVAAGKGGAGR